MESISIFVYKSSFHTSGAVLFIYYMYTRFWFSPHHKSYLCLNRQIGQIYVSRHVVFNEFSFPFSSSSSSPPHSSMFTPNISISISFHFSTTQHPISILASSFSSSSHFLHRFTFPLSSHSPSFLSTSLSPRLSHDTHSTTSVRLIPFIVPTD